MAAFETENEAIDRLFNRMASRKVAETAKQEFARESGVELQRGPAEPLPPPDKPRPVQSSYLERKKKEEAAKKEKERQRQETLRKQIEEDQAAVQRMNEQLHGKGKKDEAPVSVPNQNIPEPVEPQKTVAQEKQPGTREEEQATQIKLEEIQIAVHGEQPTKPSSPEEKPGKKNAFGISLPFPKKPKPETQQKPDETNNEPPTTSVKGSTESPKKKNTGKDIAPRPDTKKPESVKKEPVLKSEPADTAVDAKEVNDALAAILGNVPTHQENGTEKKKSTSLAVKNSDRRADPSQNALTPGMGMHLSKPKTGDTLSVTEIIPLKSDYGSVYDSAVKPSNAFRSNVFLDCSYNEKTHEGGYGLVVDMGNKRLIQGVSGRTSDEWEYGFRGIVDAIKICLENNVKEVMFVIREPLCEIIQQNTEGMIWGYSMTRQVFYNTYQDSKRHFASGFYSGELQSDELMNYRDLAETISRTLIFPPK